MRKLLRAHPVIVSVFAVCTLGGALLAVQVLSGEWSLLHKLAGGAVGGAGVALLVTATNMFQ